MNIVQLMYVSLYESRSILSLCIKTLLTYPGECIVDLSTAVNPKKTSALWKSNYPRLAIDTQ